jgi:hypothetical protein
MNYSICVPLTFVVLVSGNVFFVGLDISYFG